jgi:hypothetical protein
MAMIHVNRGATSLGAFPEEQVREGLRTGRFLSSDLGWREGMASWQVLSQFPEFAADISAAQAAPSPAVAATQTTPAVAGMAAGAPAPGSGLPWDQRREKGFFNAFIETLQMVLSRPGDAFNAMRREGGLGEPLLYAVIGGSFGFIACSIYNIVLQSLGFLTERSNPVLHLVGAGLGGILAIIFAPLFIVIIVFIYAAILHVCLMIVGGAKQAFETTFRVVCFTIGSVNPLQIIPLCGTLIAAIWGIVLYCIGLARAHETDTGRAVIAVLLPVIFCCCGGILLAMMFGMLGAWGASQH